VADLGYINTLLSGIKDAALQRTLKDAFRHVVQEARFGVPEHHTRATNFSGIFESSTTASDTNEFSIAHGLPSTPHLAIPMLDLSQPGAKFVPLEVSKAADSKRLYFKVPAGSTGAPFCVLVE
jgi:hypothetical protein